MALIFLGILVVIVILLVGMYNSLVQLRVRCDNAWSDIDVQLKRRHDLIPNLVETVKGYAAHEKGTFENIAKFRSQAMQATGPVDKAQAENQLTGALKSLFAVAENYPQLQASEEFTQLQSSLNQTEDAIQNARRYYNAVVRDLNTKIQSFPTNILAGMFGFQQKQFFEAAAADREPVAVKFWAGNQRGFSRAAAQECSPRRSRGSPSDDLASPAGAIERCETAAQELSMLNDSFALLGLDLRRLLTHGLRRELHSCAASRLWAKSLRSKLLVLVCFAALTTPLFAQSWRIADFKDTIAISDDGTALVRERSIWSSSASGTAFIAPFRSTIPDRTAPTTRSLSM